MVRQDSSFYLLWRQEAGSEEHLHWDVEKLEHGFLWLQGRNHEIIEQFEL